MKIEELKAISSYFLSTLPKSKNEPSIFAPKTNSENSLTYFYSPNSLIKLSKTSFLCSSLTVVSRSARHCFIAAIARIFICAFPARKPL